MPVGYAGFWLSALGCWAIYIEDEKGYFDLESVKISFEHGLTFCGDNVD